MPGNLFTKKKEWHKPCGVSSYNLRNIFSRYTVVTDRAELYIFTDIDKETSF